MRNKVSSSSVSGKVSWPGMIAAQPRKSTEAAEQQRGVSGIAAQGDPFGTEHKKQLSPKCPPASTAPHSRAGPSSLQQDPYL